MNSEDCAVGKNMQTEVQEAEVLAGFVTAAGK